MSHRKSRPRSHRNGDRYGIDAGNAYNENAHEFAESGRVGPAARDARNAVDGSEAADLHAAEEAGKARMKLSPTDQARAILHRLGRAARAALYELRH